MTSLIFHQSKYDNATQDQKFKVIKELAKSIVFLTANVDGRSNPIEKALNKKIDSFLEMAINLEARVCNDQRLCRGCFVISDTINTCQSCWEVQACDYCTDDEWNLSRECESCDNAVCWKEECKICDECKNYKECKNCGDRKRIKAGFVMCDDCLGLI